MNDQAFIIKVNKDIKCFNLTLNLHVKIYDYV